MLKAAVVLLSLSVLPAAVRTEDAFISKGQWLVESLEQCSNPETYEVKIDVVKFRKSRGVDGLNATLELPSDLTVNWRVEVKIEKMTNGGFKNFQLIKQDSFLRFVRNNSGENFDRMMEHMNLKYSDPDPIPKGSYTVNEFVLDICALPEEGIVGEFKSTVYLINESAVIKGCAIAYVTFTQDDDVCGRKKDDE